MKKNFLIVLNIVIIGCSVSTKVKDKPSDIYIENKPSEQTSQQTVESKPDLEPIVLPTTSTTITTTTTSKPTIECAFSDLLVKMNATTLILDMIKYRILPRQIGNISIHTEMYTSTSTDEVVFMEVHTLNGDPQNIVKKIGYKGRIEIIEQGMFTVENTSTPKKKDLNLYKQLYSISTLPSYPIVWENDSWTEINQTLYLLVKPLYNIDTILEIYPVRFKEVSDDNKITVTI